MSAEVFQPAGEKGEVEKNKGGEEDHQMKLNQHSGIKVIHCNGLSNKDQGRRLSESESQDKIKHCGRSDHSLKKWSRI